MAVKKEKEKTSLCTLCVGLFMHIRKIGKSDNYLHHVCPPVRPSAWINSASIGGIFIKFDISIFFENLSRTFNFL